MTIHSTHPFATPEPERDPLRRLRGRMPAPVSVWAAGQGAGRAGWTLSSFLVVDGEPAEVIGVLDEDSALAELLTAAEPVCRPVGSRSTCWAGTIAGSPMPSRGWRRRPGGPFTLGRWRDSDWGPVLDDAPGWLGVRLQSVPDQAGWSLLVRGTVDHVELGQRSSPRGCWPTSAGRYRAVSLEVSRSR